MTKEKKKRGRPADPANAGRTANTIRLLPAEWDALTETFGGCQAGVNALVKLWLAGELAGEQACTTQ